eukprot:4316449-Karenia_brevis.AAC.1
MAGILTKDHGHRLIALDVGVCCAIVCSSCGAWATKTPKLLATPCRGAANAAGHAALKAVFQRGVLPTRPRPRRVLGAVPFALDDEDLERIATLRQARAAKVWRPITVASPEDGAPAESAGSSSQATDRLSLLRARVVARQAT